MTMWLTTRNAVEDAVSTLYQRRIHEHFPGYLCMLWTAIRSGRTDSLHPDFTSFHDYFLRVPGRKNYPYLRPFTSKLNPSDTEAIWLGENVAGSYAPSSIREGGTLPRVIEVTGMGQGATYALRPNHSKLALDHLAIGQRVPAVPLSLFLYRDYSFDEPSAAAAVSVFRYEFGLEDDSDYAQLFQDDSDASDSSDLFEYLQ
jgi:hypothetical protein